MYKLEKVKEIFLVEAQIPYKNDIGKTSKIKLVFDPGAAFSIIDTGHMDYLGYSAARDMVRKSTLDGAAGESKGFIIEVPFIVCMKQKLSNFQIACHDMNSRLGITGLLGMNFIKNFRMDIDYGSGEVFKISKN